MHGIQTEGAQPGRTTGTDFRVPSAATAGTMRSRLPSSRRGPRARAEARNGPAATWLGACAAGSLGVGDSPRMARESSKRTRQPAVSAEYQGAMVPLETTSRSRWASGYPGSIRAACLTLFAAKELVHDHQWRYPATARAACSPRTR